MKIDEDADLAERLAQQQPAERLHHADQQPAEQRAGEAAHAAEHDDREGDQHEAGADLRVHVVRRQQEARRRAQAGQADAEAHRVDVVDVDAAQPRALLLLRDGADRAAEVGAHDDQPAAAPAAASAPPKATSLGSAIIAGPIATVVSV